MKFDNFRLKLRHEAQNWRDEGIINPEQYQTIASRYGFERWVGVQEFSQVRDFDTIGRTANLWLIAFGSTAVGIGIIMLMAAVWHELTPSFKVILLLGILFLINTLGFYLWRNSHQYPYGKFQRKLYLGQGLILLGTVVFGISLAIIAQEFNLQLHSTEIYLLWAIAGLTMAYSLRFNFLGILSLLLVAIAYWQGISSFPEMVNTRNLAAIIPSQIIMVLATQHLHLLVLISGITLASICRSRSLFCLTVFLFTCIFLINLSHLNTSPRFADGKTALGLMIPPALLWTYNDSLFLSKNPNVFASLAKKFALFILAAFFYVFSWQWFWQNPTLSWLNVFPYQFSTNIFVGIDLSILLAIIAFQIWNRLRWRHRHQTRLWQDAAAFLLILIAGSLPLWRYTTVDISVIFFTSLSIGMGVALIGYGISFWQKLPFWGGMLLLGLQILSRVGEYTNNLLTLSLTWIACGFFLTAAGIWFEMRWRSRRAATSFYN